MLADLGLCKKEDDTINNGEIYGKIPYLAPEVLNSGLYTKAADVYSFGIILWVLKSFRMPFSNMSHDASLMARIINGKRPEIVEGTPKLIQECWNKDPTLRPTIEVYEKIRYPMIIGNRRDRYGFIKHETPQIENDTKNYGNVPSIKIGGTDCFIKVC